MSPMATSFPPAERQALVASFLEVAVGQTVDTAHQFLQIATMNLPKTYLEDLTNSSTPLDKTMLLKITMKKPANEINGRATYQGYTFMDEHGTRRRANVFGRQIDLFDKVLTEGEVCQLSLPIVKKADAQYAMYPGEQQLTLCGSTRIRILPTPERPIDFKPRYLPLSEIKNMLFKQTYDIVAVVVRVDPPHQVKSQATGLPLDLAYVYITDDSVDGVIELATWKAHAHHCQKIPDCDYTGNVVAFNDVRTVTYKNKITLSTTYGSQIDLDASGDRQSSLQNWSKTQNLNLTSRKHFIPDIQTIETQIQTTTLKSALQKKHTEVQQNDLLKVDVYVIAIGRNSPRTRLVCPNCSMPFFGKGEEGQKCTSCVDPGPCTAKLVLDFTASDDETTYEFAAMTKTAEKILSIKAIEYHNMSKEERITFNANALTALLTKKVSLIIKPSPSHLDHNKVEWELKYMEGH